MPNFDSIARPYQLFENLAFGSALQKARTHYLSRAASARNILIIGEGNGRHLAELRKVNATAEITVIDLSPAMLALARRRDPSVRTEFIQADITRHTLPAAHYDLLVTHFLLDCFPQPEIDVLIPRLSAALTPTATWLVADFHLPPTGLARLHARIWLATMYAFFRLITGLPAKALPEFDSRIQLQGFGLKANHFSRCGLIRTTCWERP